MAIPTTYIPVLEGKAARRFEARAKAALLKRGSIDKSEGLALVEAILKKSTIK